MKRFDMIAFDCDGVLVDSEPITMRVYAEELAQLGWQMSVEEAMQRFVGRTFRDELVMIEAQIGRKVPDDFFPAYAEKRDIALAAEVQAVHGVRAVIDGLIAAGAPYCVASGAERAKMQVTLGRTGLLPLFAGRMFSGSDVANSKPAPDVYLLAARSMGMDPQRCVAIEDTPTGVRAAVAAGMAVFGYAGLTDGAALRAAGASTIFTEMAALPALLA